MVLDYLVWLQNLTEWSQFMALNWLLAGLILIGGWYGSKLLVRLLRPNVARHFQRKGVANSVLRSVRALVMVGLLFVVMGVLGVEISSLLFSVTVLSAVVGVTLAPVASNIISGFFILANRPYAIDDMIELVDEDKRGYVDDITLRFTKIRTLDNTFLVIPNATIHDRDVINHSGDDERTRISIEFAVTYEGDLQEARTLIERAARDVDGVIEGGPSIRIGTTRYIAQPKAFITEFGDHGVVLTLRCWVERPYLPLPVRSQIHENIWDQLEDADVEMAYPHSHLVFDETSGRARVTVDQSGSLAEESPPTPEESVAD